jgi:hypothetical protein
MKKILYAILTVTLLAASLCGTAGAAVSTDAKSSMVFWSPASAGFMYDGDHPWIRSGATVNTTFWNAETRTFTGPLTLPSQVNGKNCTVGTVWVRWMAPNLVRITHVGVYSGETQVAGLDVNVPGTDGNVWQTDSFSLGGSYQVPYGLAVNVTFFNNAPAINDVWIGGYGAKVKYKVV